MRETILCNVLIVCIVGRKVINRLRKFHVFFFLATQESFISANPFYNIKKKIQSLMAHVFVYFRYFSIFGIQ